MFSALVISLTGVNWAWYSGTITHTQCISFVLEPEDDLTRCFVLIILCRHVATHVCGYDGRLGSARWMYCLV